MLAGDLGRRTGRSESYPRSSLGVPRQVLTHGAVKLTFRGGHFYGISPLLKGNGSEPRFSPIIKVRFRPRFHCKTCSGREPKTFWTVFSS